MNSMNIKNHEKMKYIREAFICILTGTLVGLVVYGFFLHFNIAIYGWNLGLIFAPLSAGYVETILANRFIGENLGAISAFFLFIYTTFYSFILKNPTLGFNIITIGSIAVILQAAFPTAVNYILFSIGFGIISYFSGIFKKITHYVYNLILGYYEKYVLKEPHILDLERIEEKKSYEVPTFNEKESNERINSLDFYFMTSTDLITRKHENIGIFNTHVIIEKYKRLNLTPQEIEDKALYELKKGKDECLIKLSEEIKSAGGNGVIDLEIQYGLIGLGGNSFQINAIGIGVKLFS